MEPQPRARSPLASDDDARALLSNLLWAASHEPTQLHGQAPRLTIHVLTDMGAYVYDPRAHVLRLHRPADLRLRPHDEGDTLGFDLAGVATGKCAGGSVFGARRVAAAIDGAIVGGRIEQFCRTHHLSATLRGPACCGELGARLGLAPPQFVALVQSIARTRDVSPHRPTDR